MPEITKLLNERYIPFEIPPGFKLLHILGNGHQSSIQQVAWSPDNLILASGSADNTIRLWDPKNGRLLHILRGHSHIVEGVAWSPDGKILASGSRDESIRLWDSATGRLIETLYGHTNYIHCISWSPDGSLLASGSSDKTIRLWDAKTGKELGILRGHDGAVYSVSWSPDGSTLASSSSDKTIRLWDIKTWGELRTLHGHISVVYCLSWSPNGLVLASGSGDETLCLWESTTGKLLQTIQCFTGSVYCMSWSPDGLTLASGSWNKTICLWNSQTGKLLQTLRGHTDFVYSVAWTPDGLSLASGSKDNTIRFWDPKTGNQTLTIKSHITSTLSWSPGGLTLASGARDNSIRLWDVNIGKLVQTLRGHTDFVNSLTWSPDGSILASGSQDKTIRLWDTKTGEQIQIFQGHTGAVNSIMWSPDGSILASGSNDATIKLWDPKTGKVLQTLDSHTDSVLCVAWSPNGLMLASGSEDKTIRLWEPRIGNLLYIFQGHTGSVLSVAWLPNGLTLASGSEDKTIRMWDIEQKQMTNILEGHTESIRTLSFSYDSQLLNSSSCNEECLWRVKKWMLISKVINNKQSEYIGSYSVFHPQKPILVTVDENENSIWVWKVDFKNLLEIEAINQSVSYTNAKVLLVGDTGTGKSCLADALMGNEFSPKESTHGRYIWVLEKKEVELEDQSKEIQEILLWDLAGQPGYRLIHQLHLNEVTIALVVFDAHSETDPFTGVYYWCRALHQAQRMQDNPSLHLIKFLIAARTDRGGIFASPERIKKLVDELGFQKDFATSAKEGWQITELAEAIRNTIIWDDLPKVSSPKLFKRIKDFLLEEKHAGRLLSSQDDLYRAFLKIKDAPKGSVDLHDQFNTCIGRLEAVGLIQRFSFGKLILLQPELLDAYAAAIINTAKEEPDGLGCIAEKDVLEAKFKLSNDQRISTQTDEKILLIATVEELLRHEIALRENTDLVFPSQLTREHPELPDPAGRAVVFRFEGPILNIYATLAVRLSRSGFFTKDKMWKNAITFKSKVKGTYGIFLNEIEEGVGDLTLFFDTDSSEEMCFQFEEYINSHLMRQKLNGNIRRRRIFKCSNCNEIITDNQVKHRREYGHKTLNCPVCETKILLLDHVERLNYKPLSKTAEMNETADNQREIDIAFSVLQGKIITNEYDVFLCYNRRDKRKVKEIADKLKKNGILPWFDEWELRPEMSWQKEIKRQIENIRSVAVFIGKDGIDPWQDIEQKTLLLEFSKQKHPVIPVILPNCNEKYLNLPNYLQGMQLIDFRKKEPEPLAQLIWGITGKRKINIAKTWKFPLQVNISHFNPARSSKVDNPSRP